MHTASKSTNLSAESGSRKSIMILEWMDWVELDGWITGWRCDSCRFDLSFCQSGDEAQDEPGDGRPAEQEPATAARPPEEPQRRQNIVCNRAPGRRCESQDHGCWLFPNVIFFQIGAYSSLPGRPYSSMSGGFTGGLDPLATDPLGLDNSQSYLGEGSNMLRDSGYGGNDSDDSNRARFLASHRFVCAVCWVLSAAITPNQSNLLREYTEFESNPPTTESKTGLSNFLPSHRLVGEALI